MTGLHSIVYLLEKQQHTKSPRWKPIITSRPYRSRDVAASNIPKYEKLLGGEFNLRVEAYIRVRDLK